MAVLRPRERLVYFRVSEDEFRQFVSICEQAGARSISDLARSAVQRLIADGNRQREDQAWSSKMHKLETLIAQVTEQLNMLNNQGQDEFPERVPKSNGSRDGVNSSQKNDQVGA